MRKEFKHKLLLAFVLTISYNAYCQRNLLQIGDDLPLFNLLDHYGRNFNSHEFLQEKPMVIFFYPKNESKLCTKHWTREGEIIKYFSPRCIIFKFPIDGTISCDEIKVFVFVPDTCKGLP